MVTLAAQPGGFARTEVAAEAWVDPNGLGVRAGTLLRADERSLDVDLGPDARLHARFSARRDWPRRAFGALGPAHAIPFLGQYWTPHLLSAAVAGEATIGRTIRLDAVYAEKNWGAAFADHWWWGQAGFDEGAGVAFAGGRIHGVAPTAVAAWTPAGVVSLAPPLARTVARAGGGEWRVSARGARCALTLEGDAPGEPLRLPVPVPGRRTLEPRSHHHLAGRLSVTVTRGRRTWLRGESDLAALELPAQ
jgi:tocopherol cyclase